MKIIKICEYIHTFDIILTKAIIQNEFKTYKMNKKDRKHEF